MRKFLADFLKLEREKIMKEKVKSIINILLKNYKFYILLICSTVFVLLLEDIYEQEKIVIDTIVYNFAVVYLRTEPITIIMKIITNLGSAYFLIKKVFQK